MRWVGGGKICYRLMSVCVCSLFARVHKINQGKELSCRTEREINAKTQSREEAENDRRGTKRQVFPTAAIPSPCWNTGIRMGGGWKAGPQRDQCNLQSAFHTLSASGLSPGSCHTHTSTHTHTYTAADNTQPVYIAASTFFHGGGSRPVCKLRSRALSDSV